MRDSFKEIIELKVKKKWQVLAKQIKPIPRVAGMFLRGCQTRKTAPVLTYRQLLP